MSVSSPLHNALIRRVQSVPNALKGCTATSPVQHCLLLEPSDSLSTLFELELDLEREDVAVELTPAKQQGNFAFDRSFSDLAKYKEELKGCETPLHKIMQLCCPTSDVCGEITRHLHAIKPECLIGSTVDVHRLADKLQDLGYVVEVWDCASAPGRQDPRVALKRLKHDFVVCLGVRQPTMSTMFQAPVIVEPMFKERFHIANPTEEYETLVKAIPSNYVGPFSKLQAIVSIVATEMSRAFQQGGFCVPPWRSHEALLSLWRPDRIEQLAARMASAALPSALPYLPGRTIAAPKPVGLATISPPGECPTPFAAYATAPFSPAGTPRRSQGDAGDDAAHRSRDTAKGAVREQGFPSPQPMAGSRRSDKPVSLLAAALQRAGQQQDSPPGGSGAAVTGAPSWRTSRGADQQWGITTVKMQGHRP